MRAPAVVIFGAGKFGAAAQLRAAGKAAGIIGRPAVAQRGEDIAAADLVAEEMRRGRHDGRIGRLCRHPVDARKMEAADAAGLVAARAGDVVQPPLKARDRADVLQLRAVVRRLLQRGDDVASLNTGSARPAPSPCIRPNSGCRSEASKPTGVGAIAPLARNFSGIRTVPRSNSREMLGIEQPCLEFAPEIVVGQDAVAVDLVLQRRFLEASAPRAS